MAPSSALAEGGACLSPDAILILGESVIRIGVLTVSDRASRGERPDLSGPALKQAIADGLFGAMVVESAVIPDECDRIAGMLARWADESEIDLILTTGGTGFAPRDVTPEATLAVVDRVAPGLGEAMRAASARVTPYAALSRACAGIRGHTLIVNLPGSPKAAVENLTAVLPVLSHAIAQLREAPDADMHR